MSKILSDNRKTGCSIDLPREGHCRPTPRCAHDCYARTGPQAWPNSTNKHVRTSNYLLGNDLGTLIGESKNKKAVRLSGAGDLLMEHVPAILKLAEACSNTQFWGMTRKLEIAKELNGKFPNLRMLVTVDPTSPEETWGYNGRLCFGPRQADDTVPNDDRILTVFPRHFAGKIVGPIPEHDKDCPAVRHKITACKDCGRCWGW